MKFHVSKLFWVARALLYKLFCKKVSFPSYIGKPLFTNGLKHISVGKRVRIFPHIRIEAMDGGTVRIDNNVYIGQNCHITSGGSELRIGEGSAIMANVCITNIDHDYECVSIPILEQGHTMRGTKIGMNCFIGHNAVIQAGAELGDHVIVGAGSVVNRGKYPSNCVLAGVPAKIIKKYNSDSAKWEKCGHE